MIREERIPKSLSDERDFSDFSFSESSLSAKSAEPGMIKAPGKESGPIESNLDPGEAPKPDTDDGSFWEAAQIDKIPDWVEAVKNHDLEVFDHCARICPQAASPLNSAH